jgi:hypothetical protein
MSIKENYDRLIIYGDVHGCFEELNESLESINYNNSKDRIIFTGDLVDRGPDSGAVVRIIRNNGFESVCGNHDYKHIRYHRHNKLQEKKQEHINPIKMSDDKIKTHEQLSEDDFYWLSSLPKSIYINRYNLLVVHAGVNPVKNPLYQSDQIYLFCRYVNNTTFKMVHLPKDFKQPKDSIFWADAYIGKTNIVYGHNVHSLEKPYILTNKYNYKTFGLDTGCVFGGNLTALVIESNKDYWIHQINAKKKYYQRH